jgi:hypothetical protein
VASDGRGGEPDLRILAEERIRAEIEVQIKESGARRHVRLVTLYATLVVLAGLIPFLFFILLYGDPSLHPFATHTLALIGGAAAGALWRVPNDPR